MSVRKELEKYNLGEIKILTIIHDSKLDNGSAEVLFPYQNTEITIEYAGKTAKEAAESLIENICCEIDDIIDHLSECKSDLEKGRV